MAAGKGRHAVFTNLSFDLPAGSLTVLAGPNGAGKTTLLNTLLGLVRLRAGSIEVLGSKPRLKRQAIGYVPQRSDLPLDAQLDGYEFVAAAFRGERWGIPLQRKAVHRAVDEALHHVAATELAHAPLADLSGGQRQRLLIAQALVNQPSLLLLDEPLANLDPGAQLKIVNLVTHLSRQEGLTVLLSTHDINPLMRAMDQVLYLAAGTGRVGPAEEVITSAVLSELYGAPIHVLRSHGGCFVMHAHDCFEHGSAGLDNLVGKH